MNTLIVSPLLIPLATLVLTLLARRAPRAVSALSLAGALALTAAGLVLVVLAAQGEILASQAGGWAAPYGITLVIDRLSAAMVAITGIRISEATVWLTKVAAVKQNNRIMTNAIQGAPSGSAE